MKYVILLLLMFSLGGWSVEVQDHRDDFITEVTPEMLKNFKELMSEVEVRIMITTFEEDWWTRKIVSITSVEVNMKVKDIHKKFHLTCEKVLFFFKAGYFSVEYRPTII